MNTQIQNLDLSWENRFSGLQRIYGPEGLQRLKAAHVCVIGMGGVGSWCAEALARSAIGTLTFVDLDESCVTNTNRQVHALDGNYGQSKVDLMAERCQAINPWATIKAIAKFATPSTIESILSPTMDFVVDAIDSTPDKAVIYLQCKALSVPLILSGASGGRIDPLALEIGDLGDEKGDGLLKSVKRRLARHHGYDPGPVNKRGRHQYGALALWSNEIPTQVPEACGVRPGQGAIGCEGGWGAASFVTGSFGLAMAGKVVSILARGN